MRYRRSAHLIVAASLAALPLTALATVAPLSERERFEAEQGYRERQQALAEREQKVREADLELRRQELLRSRWSSPLVLAVLAAAIAAIGNAIVTHLNGRHQRTLEGARADASRQLERDKAEAQIELERDKSAAQRELESDKAAAQRALDEQQAESDRILEAIKTGGSSEASVRNLQFLLEAGLVTKAGLVDRLSSYLARLAPGTGPTLPSADGRFRFEAGTETSATLPELSRTLAQFCAHLDAIGFARPAGEVSIAFGDIGDFDNAYYQPGQRRIMLGASFREDPDVALHQYMRHVLAETALSRPEGNAAFEAIATALADYFPLSFLGRPHLGEKAARALKRGPYIRSLTSPKGYAELGAGDTFDDAEIWGSLFWDIRQEIGQGASERLLRAAWTTTQWPRGRHKAALAFIAAMLAEAAAGGAAGQEAVKAELVKRGYPVPPERSKRA
jgi:hypothetical protein